MCTNYYNYLMILRVVKQLLPGQKHNLRKDLEDFFSLSLFPSLVFHCVARDPCGPLALTPVHVSGPRIGSR